MSTRADAAVRADRPAPRADLPGIRPSRRCVHRRSLTASAQLFDRGFDAVVLGHTHLPEITERPGGLFVNSGDCLKRFTYVRIAEGDIALKRWDG